MPLSALLQSTVTFLRAGYPEGVPAHDYQPLFALLRRQLSPEEVELVAAELTGAGDPASVAAIHTAIRAATTVVPTDADIARVQSRLTASGWPNTPSR